MHLSKIDYGHTRHCGDCKELACANKQRKGHFGKFELGSAHGASKILAPPPPKFQMLRRLSLPKLILRLPPPLINKDLIRFTDPVWLGSI